MLILSLSLEKMSPTKSVTTVATTHIRRLSSSSSPPPSSSSPLNNKQVLNTVKKWETPSNQWAPFQTKADFTLDVTVLLIFIVCFILGFFLLNYLANRFIFITTSTSDHDDNNDDGGGDRNRASKEIIKNRDKFDKASGPTLEFSKGIKMVGTESGCAVCLSEFVDGEGIRVLPKCNHGFHINCIEKWLLNFKNSCPTCRTNCLNSSVPTMEMDFFDDESGGHVESGGAAATELAVIRTGDYLQEEGSSGSSSSSSTAAVATTVVVAIAVTEA